MANDMVRNLLYHNGGDGTFKDVTYGAGVGFDADGKPSRAWAPTAETTTAMAGRICSSPITPNS